MNVIGCVVVCCSHKCLSFHSYSDHDALLGIVMFIRMPPIDTCRLRQVAASL